MIVARFRKCSDLVQEGKVFVKNKTKVASGVGCRFWFFALWYTRCVHVFVGRFFSANY